MDKQAVISLLEENHQIFISKISSLSDTDFNRKIASKWTSSQQLEHIIKSVKPVDMAFSLPMFVLKMKFGLANRPSKTYPDLVKKYLKTLEKNKGYEVPPEFTPEEIPLARKEKSLKKLKKLASKLASRIPRFSEEELDTYILPHPLMGKLTLREMLYFTAYHVEHHDRQILENLKLK
ncbi:DinB family protein [uncultured Croceitalea sp.]|uniref:DinB family protein n=1 Tax=uncultured Croceitalea sp. TaxID=1798908 RepID=UPI003306670D